MGNVADRILRGYVVDFIHLHHWPIFNVADALLVAGMIVLALSWRWLALWSWLRQMFLPGLEQCQSLTDALADGYQPDRNLPISAQAGLLPARQIGRGAGSVGGRASDRAAGPPTVTILSIRPERESTAPINCSSRVHVAITLDEARPSPSRNPPSQATKVAATGPTGNAVVTTRSRSGTTIRQLALRTSKPCGIACASRSAQIPSATTGGPDPSR